VPQRKHTFGSRALALNAMVRDGTVGSISGAA
jgi:hypothetical protein